jgi:hypothetical protein
MFTRPGRCPFASIFLPSHGAMEMMTPNILKIPGVASPERSLGHRDWQLAIRTGPFLYRLPRPRSATVPCTEWSMWWRTCSIQLFMNGIKHRCTIIYIHI